MLVVRCVVNNIKDQLQKGLDFDGTAIKKSS